MFLPVNMVMSFKSPFIDDEDDWGRGQTGVHRTSHPIHLIIVFS